MRAFSYFVREAFVNLKKNSLIAIAAISTVMISLVMLGFFLLVIVNINFLSQQLSSKVEIAAYLRSDVTEKERVDVQSHIQALPSVKEVVYVPKEEALQKLQKSLGEKVRMEDIIASNPLPDAFEVKVKDPRAVAAAAKEIQSYPEVDEVVFGQEILSKLLSISYVVQVVGLISIALLGLATILLIMNTIRLTVFSRRKEIRIMQLVGATDWFIRWPFLLEGTFQGLIGAALACSFLWAGYSYLVNFLKHSLPFLPFVQDTMMLVHLCVILVTFGAFLGTMGSLLAVGRFLIEA